MRTEGIERLRTCPVCQAERFRDLPLPSVIVGEAYFAPYLPRMGLVRCRGCGLEFVNPRPTDEVMLGFHASGRSSSPTQLDGNAIPHDWRVSFDVRLDAMAALTSGRRVLDCGYGWGPGLFARQARQRGWQVVVVDPFPDSVAAARIQGVEAYASLAELPANRREFDVVTMKHALEHQPDMLRTLSESGRMLGEGGLLVVEVPNLRSLRARLFPLVAHWSRHEARYRAFPTRLYAFSAYTLRLLMVRLGYRVMRIVTYGLGVDRLFRQEANTPAARNAGEHVPSESTDNEAKPRRAFRPSSPVRRLVKRVMSRLDLGESMIVLARKGG
jgi:SAM-dependent methyltransferase